MWIKIPNSHAYINLDLVQEFEVTAFKIYLRYSLTSTQKIEFKSEAEAINFAERIESKLQEKNEIM